MTTYPPIPDRVPVFGGQDLINDWITASHHVLSVQLIMDGSLMRTRQLTYTRPRGPELTHRTPLCGLCDNECYWADDGWACETCEVYWPYEGGDGEWQDDAPQCMSMHQPWLNNQYAKPEKRQDWVRCHLSQGHKTQKHRAEFLHAWYDDGTEADPWS